MSPAWSATMSTTTTAAALQSWPAQREGLRVSCVHNAGASPLASGSVTSRDTSVNRVVAPLLAIPSSLMPSARELATVLEFLQTGAASRRLPGVKSLQFRVPKKFSDRRDWYV